MSKKSYPSQIGITFCVSLTIIVTGVLARQTLAGWSLPEGWVANAALAAPEAKPIAPVAIAGLVSNAGVFFGLAWGAIWLRKWGWFDATGDWWVRVLRFLIGILGVFVLWKGLGGLFPRGETVLPLMLRYLRYFLVGIWVAGLAPALFIRLRLAQKME